MLTPKQEVLTRIVTAYVRSAALVPGVNMLAEMKVLAESIVGFGDDARVTVTLPPETTIGALNFSVRALSCLKTVATDFVVAPAEDVPLIRPRVLHPYLSEEEMSIMKNVGLTTINEIKQKFALCGLAIPLRRSE